MQLTVFFDSDYTHLNNNRCFYTHYLLEKDILHAETHCN
jgi:hypothetical protein